MELNLKKPSPLKRNACNKSTITVCKNSMQLRWGMEIRMGNSTFIGYDDGVYIEYISYDSDPNVTTATVRLSENIDSQITAGTDVTFHGDRGLNFHPDRKITGLNVIDSMIFWTDNHSEPKKINIERGKLGSLSSIYGAGFDGSDISPEPYTWYGLGETCRGGLIMPDGSPSLACFSDFDQHTKLIAIEKHIMDCEKSTLDCDIFGCTNAAAINWNPAANTDDGSCIVPLPPVYGCDDGTWGVANSNACNSGISWWNTGGSNFNALNGGGTYGNTDDYNINDTSLCVFKGYCEICDPVTGGTMGDPSCGDCIDSNAINAGSGSLDCLGNSGGTDYSCCQYCIDPLATNYYAGANDCSGVAGGGDNSCCSYPPPIDGCTDSSANNYNPAANIEDGSCAYTGCTDLTASNTSYFNHPNPGTLYTNPIVATTSDGSCVFPPPPTILGCMDVNTQSYTGPFSNNNNGALTVGNTMCAIIPGSDSYGSGSGIPGCCCYTPQCNGGYDISTTAPHMPTSHGAPLTLPPTGFDVIDMKVGVGNNYNGTWSSQWATHHNGDDFPNIFHEMQSNGSYFPSSGWKGWSFEYAPGDPTVYTGMDPQFVANVGETVLQSYESPVVQPHINANGNLEMGVRPKLSNVTSALKPWASSVGVYFDMSTLPDNITNGFPDYDNGFDVVVVIESIKTIEQNNSATVKNAPVWSGTTWGQNAQFSVPQLRMGIGGIVQQVGLGSQAERMNVGLINNKDYFNGNGILNWNSTTNGYSLGSDLQGQMIWPGPPMLNGGNNTANPNIPAPYTGLPYNPFDGADKPFYPLKLVQAIEIPPLGAGKNNLFMLGLETKQDAIASGVPNWNHRALVIEISSIKFVRRDADQVAGNGVNMQNGTLI